MTTFLGIHDMRAAGQTTDTPNDMLKNGWQAYKAASAKIGIKPTHVHLNTAKGRAFCITEANSADEVQKAHDEAKVPLVEILEVETWE